jgi:hypothetical protein
MSGAGSPAERRPGAKGQDALMDNYRAFDDGATTCRRRRRRRAGDRARRPRSASTSAACTCAPTIIGCRCSTAAPTPRSRISSPHNLDDFGPHSVLLDFTGGSDDPEIAFIGRALRTECELERRHPRISDVPSRSLLSRLTDHYLQIIANRAPIGFEAEFVSQRGVNTMYRGILMPLLVGRRHDRLHLRRDQLEGSGRRQHDRRRHRPRSRPPRRGARAAGRLPGLGRRPQCRAPRAEAPFRRRLRDRRRSAFGVRATPDQPSFDLALARCRPCRPPVRSPARSAEAVKSADAAQPRRALPRARPGL